MSPSTLLRAALASETSVRLPETAAKIFYDLVRLSRSGFNLVQHRHFRFWILKQAYDRLSDKASHNQALVG